MKTIESARKKIACGQPVTKEEALALLHSPLEALKKAADEIRETYMANAFDLCTIINGKSGQCSEDCKYCAQSAHFKANGVETYPLLSTEEVLKQAKYNEVQGIPRFSIVTSGKRLSDQEVDQVCETIRAIRKETHLIVCVSFGLLNEANFRKIKAAGAARVHCNLESSRHYFKEVCTTHTYDEKIETLKAAEHAGLSICSGGIMGLGESMEDRIDMALTLRDLGVKSVPINLLNPIPGTPYGKNKVLTNDELCRIVAIYRFLLPDAFLRLAGGRGLLPDGGKECFKSGVNAAISGDMLTTSGMTVKRDKQLISELGFEVKILHE